MKSSERHRLKENELAHSLSAAREFIEPRRRQITGAVIALVLVAVAVIAMVVIRQRSASQGEDLLAEAMVALNAPVVPPQEGDPAELPAAAQFEARGSFSTETAKLQAATPKLKAAADAHPDSQAGITARYHLAGAYAALGQHADAIREFEEVSKRAGNDSIYGRMALLGKADAQARANQLDAAIASWKELAAKNDENLPTDAILMELGKAYAQKGNREEARKTYTQLVDQHPDSPYSTEARQELEILKRSV